MRDPERIDKVLAAVGEVWKQYPDLRFTQLIGNLPFTDPYYMEDDHFIRELYRFYGGKKDE